jgi:hypothetical protein
VALGLAVTPGGAAHAEISAMKIGAKNFGSGAVVTLYGQALA